MMASIVELASAVPLLARSDGGVIIGRLADDAGHVRLLLDRSRRRWEMCIVEWRQQQRRRQSSSSPPERQAIATEFWTRFHCQCAVGADDAFIREWKQRDAYDYYCRYDRACAVANHQRRRLSFSTHNVTHGVQKWRETSRREHDAIETRCIIWIAAAAAAADDGDGDDDNDDVWHMACKTAQSAVNIVLSQQQQTRFE